jgi:hypothetical protein
MEWAFTKENTERVICRCFRACAIDEALLSAYKEVRSLVAWRVPDGKGSGELQFFGELCKRTFSAVAEGLAGNRFVQAGDLFNLPNLIGKGAFSGDEGCTCNMEDGVCKECNLRFSASGTALLFHKDRTRALIESYRPCFGQQRSGIIQVYTCNSGFELGLFC